jgi:hypothetical protein
LQLTVALSCFFRVVLILVSLSRTRDRDRLDFGFWFHPRWSREVNDARAINLPR